jgi:hypothetical protein
VASLKARKAIDLGMLTISVIDANSLNKRKNLRFPAGARAPGIGGQSSRRCA